MGGNWTCLLRFVPLFKGSVRAAGRTCFLLRVAELLGLLLRRGRRGAGGVLAGRALPAVVARADALEAVARAVLARRRALRRRLRALLTSAAQARARTAAKLQENSQGVGV